MKQISHTVAVIFVITAIANNPLPLRADSHNSPCPKPLDGQRDVGPYNFGYQSWTWPTKPPARPNHVFCYCIRNNNKERALAFHWERTGLQGFVRPEGVSYKYDAYPQPTHKKPLLKLWYGASPQKIDVVTLIPIKESRISDRIFQFPLFGYDNHVTALHLITATTASDIYGKNENSIVTRSKISMPYFDPRRFKRLSGVELAEFIEQNPQHLIDVTMSFASSIIPDTLSNSISEIKNSCSYEISRQLTHAGSWPSELLLEFEDKRLQNQMFGRSNPVRIRWQGHRGDVFRIESKQSLTNVARDVISKKFTRLLFRSSNGGSVIATMPVRFFVYDR